MLHVFAGVAKTGAEGKTTAYTTLPGPQGPTPTLPAGNDPHAADKTYRASNV